MSTLEQAALAFFQRCWNANQDGRVLDGSDYQEWGLELGLLQRVVAPASCGAGCVCEEFVGDDFPTDCYRLVYPRVDDPKARE